MEDSDESDAYKDLIAGSSEEESESGDDQHRSDAHIEAMRQKLLGGLTGDDHYSRQKDIQASDSEELDV